MNKPIRLHSIVERRGITTYGELRNYVYHRCGAKLKSSVDKYKSYFEGYFEEIEKQRIKEQQLKQFERNAAQCFWSNAPAPQKRLNSFHNGRLM